MVLLRLSDQVREESNVDKMATIFVTINSTNVREVFNRIELIKKALDKLDVDCGDIELT